MIRDRSVVRLSPSAFTLLFRLFQRSRNNAIIGYQADARQRESTVVPSTVPVIAARNVNSIRLKTRSEETEATGVARRV